jgi:hypothetical protein
MCNLKLYLLCHSNNRMSEGLELRRNGPSSEACDFAANLGNTNIRNEIQSRTSQRA